MMRSCVFVCRKRKRTRFLKPGEVNWNSLLYLKGRREHTRSRRKLAPSSSCCILSCSLLAGCVLHEWNLPIWRREAVTRQRTSNAHSSVSCCREKRSLCVCYTNAETELKRYFFVGAQSTCFHCRFRFHDFTWACLRVRPARDLLCLPSWC